MHTQRKKIIRGNDKTSLIEAFSKTIMQRTHFRNNSLEISIDENKRLNTKQRNVCLSLLRKDKNT